MSEPNWFLEDVDGDLAEQEALVAAREAGPRPDAGLPAGLMTYFFRHGGELVVDFDQGSWAVTTRSARVRPAVCGSGKTLGGALEDLTVKLGLREGSGR